MPYIGLYQNRASTIQKRRELRTHQTKAERLLWQRIRSNQLGVKFRRQYNIDYYIVDFYCHELRLIIEVDGLNHEEEEQKRKDTIRDNYLKKRGYIVLRYWNEKMMFDIEEILENLKWQIAQLPTAKGPHPTLPL